MILILNVLARNWQMVRNAMQEVLFTVSAEQKIHPGKNVGRGGDDTLFATVNGVVKYERLGKNKKQVSVYPEA